MGSGAPMNCRLNGHKCDGTPDAPPSAPTNLRSPAASYDVYAGSTLATNVTGTTANVTGLAPSTAYSFTVRARDNYDNLSGPSNAVSVTTDDVIGGGNYFVRNLDPVNLTCLNGVTRGTTQNPQGEAPAPQGAHLDWRLDLLEVLLRRRPDRGVQGEVRPVLY